MDLRRPRFAHHPDDFAGSGAADDRIVDQHDTFAGDQLAHRIELDPHAKIPDLLLRLNKGTSHVVVADEPELEGDARGPAETESGEKAAVGHWHHQVGRRRLLLGERFSHLGSYLRHRIPEEPTVRPGEIDVFESAATDPRGRPPGQQESFDRAAPRNHDLARFELADTTRLEDVESAGLRSKTRRAAQIPQPERPKSERVARRDQAVAGQKQDRIGARNPFERQHQRFDDRFPLVFGHQVQDHFGVAGGLENRALGLEFLAQLRRVDQIAVVHQRQRPHASHHHHRLGVGHHTGTGGRISGVADRPETGEPLQGVRVEDVRHLPHAPFDLHLAVVPDGQTATLLPPMLQGIKTEVGHGRRFIVQIDTKNSTHIPVLPPTCPAPAAARSTRFRRVRSPRRRLWRHRFR